LLVEDAGVVVVVFEVLAVVLDGVLAGTEDGGEAGVEGAVEAVKHDDDHSSVFYQQVSSRDAAS